MQEHLTCALRRQVQSLPEACDKARVFKLYYVPAGQNPIDEKAPIGISNRRIWSGWPASREKLNARFLDRELLWIQQHPALNCDRCRGAIRRASLREAEMRNENAGNEEEEPHRRLH
jgi:hypothetical protein